MLPLFNLLLVPPALALDLTPLYGSEGGGNLSHISTDSTLTLASSEMKGVILSWPISDFQDMEVYYSQQQTHLQQGDVPVPPEDLISLDIRTLHVGGTVLSDEGPSGLQGFLSGGIGLTHYTPSLGVSASEVRPSASVGLGVRWMPTQRLGVRLEGRLYGSLFNNTTTIFCSGGCSFSISGDLLTQYALYAGVVFRFD